MQQLLSHEQMIAQLADIYDVVHVPWWQTIIGKLGIALSIILCALLVMYFCYRWYRARYRYIAVWQRAIDLLNALTKNTYATAEERSQAYSRIVVIVKQFFAQQYALPVASATDTEFMKALADSAVQPSFVERCKQLCEETTFARFASPTSAQYDEQLRQLVEKAVTLIRDVHVELNKQTQKHNK